MVSPAALAAPEPVAELLPCPFCGDTELKQSAFRAALDVYYKVRCCNCGGQCEGWTEDDAVARWNRRLNRLAPE